MGPCDDLVCHLRASLSESLSHSEKLSDFESKPTVSYERIANCILVFCWTDGAPGLAEVANPYQENKLYVSEREKNALNWSWLSLSVWQTPSGTRFSLDQAPISSGDEAAS